MAGMVDSRLFAELAERKKKNVIQPGWCEYSEAEHGYMIKAWGGNYVARPAREEITALPGTTTPHEYFCVFLVNYLLSEKPSEPFGEWISEKDLTGGATFFRGPHAIPTHLISKAFGNDPAALQKKSLSLNGQPIELADIAFAFDVIGAVKVALLYWLGDEDFPAEAKLLIDRSVAGTLQLDVVFALLCDTCYRISQ